MASYTRFPWTLDITWKPTNLGYLGLLPTNSALQWACQPAQIYSACKPRRKGNWLHIKWRSSVLDQKHHKEDEHRGREEESFHVLWSFKHPDLGGGRRCWLRYSCQGTLSISKSASSHPEVYGKINPLGIAQLPLHSCRGWGRPIEHNILL